MTRVDFYFNAESKADTARRLVAKAWQAGQRTLIYTADPALAEAVDQLLWTRPPLSFLPHVRCGHPLVGETPVLIGTDADVLPSHDLLINLDGAWPPCFSRFERLIELVGCDEADKVRGRERWQFYKSRGYPLQKVDLSKG